MSEKFVDSMSSSQEIASLRRGIKLKNENYTNNVLLIMIKQLEKGGEVATNYINNSGVCSLIEHLFEKFRTSRPIVLNALIILNFFVSIAAGSSSTLSKHLLTRTDPCSGLISSIACHILDHQTINESVKLLLFLTSEENLLRKLLLHQSQRMKSVASDAINCDDLSTVGVSDVLLQIVSSYSVDTRLMEKICHVIYNVAYDEDENTSEGCRSYLSFLGFGKFLVDGILKQNKYVATSRTGLSPTDGDTVTCAPCACPSRESNHQSLPDSVSDNILDNTNSGKCNGSVSSERQIHQTITASISQRDGNRIHSSSELEPINFGLSKWGLRALGALCREHTSNQQALYELGACEVVIHLNEFGYLSQLRGTDTEYSAFLESFCWAVGNLADPSGGCRSNQDALIELGACEAVIEALKGHVTQAETGGHLAQESCRALRHLCFQNKLGLDKMHRLGACAAVLDIIRSALRFNRASPTSARPFASSTSVALRTSAVQWAWFTVTALAREDDDEEDNDELSELKCTVRATFGQLGACALLQSTYSAYGTSASSSSFGAADIIQWSFSAMAVLAEDTTNAQYMLLGESQLSSLLSISPTSETGDVRPLNSEAGRGVDRTKTGAGTGTGTTIVESIRSNYSFFKRNPSISSSNSLEMDHIRGLGSMEVDGDLDKAMSNALTIVKAMQSHISSEDVAEEFGKVICSLTATPSSRKKCSEGGIDDSFIRQRNKQLLVSAGSIELLVKVLIAHEASDVEGDMSASPVASSVCAAIGQIVSSRNSMDGSGTSTPSEACLSIDRLVSSGFLKVLSRVLAQPCALCHGSPIALCGLRIIHDIACCRTTPAHHKVLLEALFADGATASLVAMIHTHFESSEEVSLATRTISLLVKSGHCRKQLSQFRTSACCCALVQSICVHCRREEHDDQVPEASILILRYLLQCMCDLMDLDTAPPDKLLRHRALLVKEGAHEAVVLLLKALKISGDALDPHFSTRNSAIVLCLETLSRLAGAPCSAIAKFDCQTRSLMWLSLPEGCLAAEIAPCAVRVGSYPAEQERTLKASIGPYLAKSIGSKDSEMLMLGGNVCCAVGNLINQATNHIFPAETSQCVKEGDVKSPADESASIVESSPQAVVSPGIAAQRSSDEIAEILIASCSVVESLFASHRRNRRPLMESGVSSDLLLAFKFCAKVFFPGTDMHLMTALCRATASISKDIEVSPGPRGSTSELDQLSLALPALCGILDVLHDLRAKSEALSLSSAQVEGSEAKAFNESSAALSGAVCSAIGNIVAAQSQQSSRFHYQRDSPSPTVYDNVEECVLKSFRCTSSSLSAACESLFALSELALSSAESARKLCSLGAQNILLGVRAVHTRPDCPPSSLPHEADAFYVIWCRAVFTLLKAAGPEFFTPTRSCLEVPPASSRSRSSSPVQVTSRESLAYLLFSVAAIEGVSAIVAASVCMALSALVAIPYPISLDLPSSHSFETMILEKIVCLILQTQVAQSDWFTLSLQAAHSISFSKTSNSASLQNSSSAGAFADAAASSVAYWSSIFIYQLLSWTQTDSSTGGPGAGAGDSSFCSTRQCALRSKCLTLGLCDVLYRSLAKYSQDESVTAACYMAISALISESAEGALTARAAPIDTARLPADDSETSRTSLDTQLEPARISGGEDDLALSDLVASARKKFIALGLGPVLVETLREHPSCRQVADWCLRCMCLLLEQSEECVHRVCAANACDVLPVNMQAHQSSELASTAGCLVIYQMIHSSHTPGAFTLTPHTHQQSSAYAIRLGGAGACEAVMSMYRCHSDSALAMVASSRAVAALAVVSKGNVGWLGPLGACEALLAAQERHSEDMEVVSAVWTAIGAMCSCNRERLSGLGTARRIVSSLRSHFQPHRNANEDSVARSRLASAAALAISRLCEPVHDSAVATCRDNRKALYTAGACKILANVLRAECSDLAASVHIFRAIATMSDGTQSFQEKLSFGVQGACSAIAAAMKLHLNHEEAALYGCQAIRALCSSGDMSNQRLFRQAGACELVTLVFQESVALSSLNSQSSNVNSQKGVSSVPEAANASVAESSGLFTQMLLRARSYSQPILVTRQSGSRPVSPTMGNPAQRAHPFPMAPHSGGTGFGATWKDRMKVSITAIRAICCLSCDSDPSMDGDQSGSNSTAKALFGAEGIVESLVDVGVSSYLVAGDRAPASLALAQWILLALCQLIDSSDSTCCNPDSDVEDLPFLETGSLQSNLNLTRLRFCNRVGEFLVTSVITSVTSSNTVAQGDADAIIYNALSVMVSMCEDRVGRHRMLCADGFAKMILQLIARYSAPAASTEVSWLLLLSLSLTSAAALSPPVADKLKQGGICRLLTTALLVQLLPAATKAIQRQSSESRLSGLSRRDSYPSASRITSPAAPATVSYPPTDGAVSGSSSAIGEPLPLTHGAAPSEKLDFTSQAQSALEHLQHVRSDYEASTFLASVQPVRVEDGAALKMRVTSALRAAIKEATAPISDGSEPDFDYDAESSDVLAISLAKEACSALTLLLSTPVPATIISSGKSSQGSRAATPAPRVRAFSSAIGFYRDSGSGGAASMGAGGASNLLSALTTVTLVADSSVLFFSSNIEKTDDATDAMTDDNYASSSADDDGMHGAVTPILLPAVKLFRDMAVTTKECVELQLSHQY